MPYVPFVRPIITSRVCTRNRKLPGELAGKDGENYTDEMVRMSGLEGRPFPGDPGLRARGHPVGVDHQPNNKLIDARLRMRSHTGSGHPMSRQELAEAVNAWQWRACSKEDRLDETDIGRLERGEIRWPGRERREA